MEQIARKDQQIISYLTLRTLIGAIGMALPVLLAVGNFIEKRAFVLEDSISDYYHTGMQNIFVGVLFVLGFFLLTYRGYERIDSIAGNLGFVFALGVALCPTQHPHAVIRNLHFISASLLFSVFIFFSLVLFTRSIRHGDRTRRKVLRHGTYVACGIVMILCLLTITGCFLWACPCILEDENIIFWLESLALWAFGISWLTKAQVLWRDQKGPVSSPGAPVSF